MSGDTDNPTPDGLTLADREPLAIRAAVTTSVTACVHVGVVLVVILVWSRPRVVPAAKVISRVTNQGRVVAGEAAARPTDTEIQVHRDVGVPGSRRLPRVVEVAVNPNLLASPDAD
jgi:hypothetical protein